MAWVYLMLASLGEILGVASINLFLKYKTFRWLLMIVLSFAFGFMFLAFAIKHIPLGTAYAVWTGLGATGAVIMGVIFFNEKASLIRMLFLTCIICGAIGLKLLS